VSDLREARSGFASLPEARLFNTGEEINLCTNSLSSVGELSASRPHGL
jgi:hypothetical protein